MVESLTQIFASAPKKVKPAQVQEDIELGLTLYDPKLLE